MEKRKNVFGREVLQSKTKLTIVEKFVLLFIKEQTKFNREESHVLKFKKWRGKTYVLSHNLTPPIHFNCRCNISPQTPIEITKSYIPDWKSEESYLTLKSEVNQGKLDDFKKDWRKEMMGARNKRYDLLFVDDLIEEGESGTDTIVRLKKRQKRRNFKI